MTRETKFGLLLVLTLTTTFGFLVWKKMHQPKDLVATTQSADQTEDGTASDDTGVAGLLTPQNSAEAVPPLAEISADRTTPRRPATPNEETPRAELSFAENPPFAVATAPSRKKPKLPVDLDQQDFFSAPKNAARAETSTTTVTAAADPDPFTAPASAPPATTEQPDPFAAQPEPTVATASPEQDPDPFRASTEIETPRNAPTLTAAPVETIDLPAETPRLERRETIAAQNPGRESEPTDVNAAADPFASPRGEAPVEVSARSSAPVPQAEVPTVPDPVLNLPTNQDVANPDPRASVVAKEPDPFFVEDSAPARTTITPRATSVPRAAAPVAEPDPFGAPAAIPELPVRAEPVPFRAETVPLRTPARVEAPVAFAGESYIVQPNDNFWTISKKVYGTGRYFEALSLYNAALVSDPSKMRPGLKIATPTEAELQSRYPKLLATTGAVVTVHDPVNLGLPADVYTVVSGDNFWEISRRLYGDGKYFRALEQHNTAIVSDPQKLKPGTRLAVPKAAWLQAKYPQLIAHVAPAVQDLKRTQPGRYQPEEPAGFFVGPGEQPMYRVGSRDTLTEIAQNYLGRSSRWVQIYEMNREVLTDGNALSVGTVLRLPADASRVAVIEGAAPRR